MVIENAFLPQFDFSPVRESIHPFIHPFIHSFIHLLALVGAKRDQPVQMQRAKSESRHGARAVFDTSTTLSTRTMSIGPRKGHVNCIQYVCFGASPPTV